MSTLDRIRRAIQMHAARERVDGLNDYVRALDIHYAQEREGRSGHMLSPSRVAVEYDTEEDERNAALPCGRRFDAIAENLGWSKDARVWLTYLQQVHDTELTDDMPQPKRAVLYTRFAEKHGLNFPKAPASA